MCEYSKFSSSRHDFNLPVNLRMNCGMEGFGLICVNACCGQVEQSKVLIKEGGVHLLLTIVDTPGFGDAVDNSNW